MIEEKGNIWNKHKEGHYITVTTNGIIKANGECVMGRGVAAQAKRLFPGLPSILGTRLTRYGNHVHLFSNLRIFSFPTKHDWKNPSDIDLIEKSCYELVELCNDPEANKVYIDKETKVYMTRPGCGNGRLRWEDVKPILERILDDRYIVMQL